MPDRDIYLAIILSCAILVAAIYARGKWLEEDRARRFGQRKEKNDDPTDRIR